jgi:hypothetical protein
MAAASKMAPLASAPPENRYCPRQAGIIRANSFRCPCCGYKTLVGRGHDEVCQVCFWHDDGQDDADADRVLDGPNYSLSLRQAPENFRAFGAAEKHVLAYVRMPLPDEI